MLTKKTKKNNKFYTTNKEWTTYDVGDERTLSVYGLYQALFSDFMSINDELLKVICSDDDIEYITYSEDFDDTCCNYYMVNLWYDNETTKRILENSGHEYILLYSYKYNTYIIYTPFFNMSNKGVKTNYKITDNWEDSIQNKNEN